MKLRKLLAAAPMASFAGLAHAAVINVEFKFTPFVGDPAKADQVTTVAGTARVYINNIFLAEQPVRQDTVPVMFEAREVSAAVWLPVASVGQALRKGKNKIRIEFAPADDRLAYRAQLRWASVTDQVSESESEGRTTSTNQANEGVDDKPAKGAIKMEREFVVDFASEQPWHRYPPVTALTDADKAALGKLLKARADLFKPKFDGIYALLKSNPQIKVDQVKKLKCLDKVYKLGVRMAPPSADQIDYALSGMAEVVLTRKGADQLFEVTNVAKLQDLKDEDTQMCAGMSLSLAYPPRVVAVRTPAGVWEVAY